MKIYLAGPMSGHPNFNFPVFDHYKAHLERTGHDVVSPADLDRETGFDGTDATLVNDDFKRRAIQRDIQALSECEAIALMPGWEHSKGVAVELAAARFLGLKTLDARTGLEFDPDAPQAEYPDGDKNISALRAMFEESEDRYRQWRREHGEEAPTVKVSEEPEQDVAVPIATDAKPKPHRGFPSSGHNRKDYPLYDGLLRYFPNALAEVAHCSKVGNDQHNPGEPLHWAKEKSSDHGNCIVRHLTQAGTLDDDGVAHSSKLAWRALAFLECEIEQQRA